MTNPDVRITELRGELKLFDQKLDMVITAVDEIKDQLKVLSEYNRSFLRTSEFNTYKKDMKPFFDWVEARITLEKFLLGLLSVIGFSQAMTLLFLFSQYFK